MTDKYYVLFYPGAGGMFLTAVLSKCLGIDTDIKISPQGHCHDMGHGVYVNTDSISMHGWHWNVDKKCTIINGHCTDLNKIKQDLPEHKIVFIDVDDDDIPVMTMLRFYKTMNPMSQREYDKFVDKFNITNWPPYATLVESPELVKDSITAYDSIWFREWRESLDVTKVDFVVPFKALHCSVDTVVRDILGMSFNQDVLAFTKDYQLKNFNLDII